MSSTELELDLGDRIARDQVLIFTDGSCFPNPGGPGGWAAVLQFQQARVELNGHMESTTNNRAELQALIEGLRALHRPHHVRWTTDSEYAISIVRHIQRGKKAKQGKPNQDLLADLRREMMKGHVIDCRWIRGHQGHLENERCDQLAGEARISQSTASSSPQPTA